MGAIIRDDKLTKIADNVKPDMKRRVILPKKFVRDNVTYHVYINSHNQIILDPQVTIPESELWIFENKNILAAIDKGMMESAKGQVTKRGSFAKYTEDEA